jgi:hypothetical protein
LKFIGEVWVGRACTGANEKELTTCAQKGGLEFFLKGHNVQKRGLALQPVGDCGTGLDGLWDSKNFAIFLIICLTFFFWKHREWAMAFGRMGVQHLHFLKLAPTLGSVKCSIPHGDWKFYFFSNFIFPKFRVHLDLHIYH